MQEGEAYTGNYSLRLSSPCPCLCLGVALYLFVIPDATGPPYWYPWKKVEKYDWDEHVKRYNRMRDKIGTVCTTNTCVVPIDLRTGEFY